MALNNQILLGSVNANEKRDFHAAFHHMAWILDHHPHALSKLITERIPFENFKDAYAERGRQSIKTIIEF